MYEKPVFTPPFDVIQKGITPYLEAYEIQKNLLTKRQIGEIKDTLLLLEHPPVITKGRRTKDDNFLKPLSYYNSEGIDIIDIERGGDVTWHEPGQIVGYIFADIRSRGGIRIFVKNIEEALIRFLKKTYGVQASRSHMNNGVFIGKNKIAAIGIAVKRGFSMHGFSLNISTTFQTAKEIIPCGLHDAGVTSVEKETGKPQETKEAARLLKRFF